MDELEDLPLKGFQEIDNTPTTFVTSLPTPKAGLYYSEVVDGLNDVIPSTESLVRIMGDEAPGAPRWKDLDSFTEGTGKGSFDSIPAASTNEYGEPIPRVNTLFLSLLPPHDTRLSIEIWREEVFSHSPTAAELATYPPVEENHDHDSYDSSSPHKRPRSLAPDDDDRRIRRRAQSDISLASSSPVFLMDGRQHLPLVDTPHDNRHQLRRSHSVPPD